MKLGGHLARVALALALAPALARAELRPIRAKSGVQCPSTEQLRAAIASRDGDRVQLTDARATTLEVRALDAKQLQVGLRDEKGKLRAARALGANAPCDHLAETAALLLGAWLDELPEFSTPEPAKHKKKKHRFAPPPDVVLGPAVIATPDAGLADLEPELIADAGTLVPEPQLLPPETPDAGPPQILEQPEVIDAGPPPPPIVDAGPPKPVEVKPVEPAPLTPPHITYSANGAFGVASGFESQTTVSTASLMAAADVGLFGVALRAQWLGTATSDLADGSISISPWLFSALARERTYDLPRERAWFEIGGGPAIELLSESPTGFVSGSGISTTNVNFGGELLARANFEPTDHLVLFAGPGLSVMGRTQDFTVANTTAHFPAPRTWLWLEVGGGWSSK